MMEYYIGVDVGTASVRAALSSCSGDSIKIVKTSVQPIQIWNDTPDHFEQSSADIWAAVTHTVTSVMTESGVAVNQVKGIGFDATCSLVVLDDNLRPLAVTLPKPNEKQTDSSRNIIMWMDHRALEEANAINNTDHSILQFVGGKISAEMEMPKILWLKLHLKNTWNKIGALFDLPDFLTWKATGSLSRSLCSLVCKWAYDASQGSLKEHGWNDDFLTKIGLSDLAKEQHLKLGQKVKAPGEPVGEGLSESSAAELGLLPGTPVGTSLIDAHAGGVGMLTCKPHALRDYKIKTENKLGLICGTSTCHMVVSEQPAFIPGVWGPYFSAMVPGMWLNEGGQSATGKVIDHILQSHPAYQELEAEASPYSALSQLISRLAQEKGIPEYALTRDLHVYPDFHGNRSPLADPTMKGGICGLTLSSSKDDLAVLYLATLQSLLYGTKHIVDEMESSGYDITAVYMCGGLIKNTLFVQMTADILNKPVVISDEPESVLLGAALLGLCAAKQASLSDVISRVKCGGTAYMPCAESQGFHSRKYKVFRQMCKDQLAYRDIMNSYS
ncbi:FGGY carbohydrate kinase domain-containing protein-like [Watersipora subatra]|uniref:FGGY carbohydrate kinase domain-containing protein-like n=1 Tax=Watersipora subatra TaxID=2589382 RepID=UPI00355BF7BD